MSLTRKRALRAPLLLLGPLLLGQALAGGCGGPTVELVLSVKTDLVPGAEFVTAEVELLDDTGVVELTPASSGDATFFDPGATIATLGGLPPSGDRRLRVSLKNGRGEAVAERVVRADNRSSLAFTVVITRDCAGVTCPLEPGAPGESCLGGSCVEEDCATGLEPGCTAEPECAVDADCAPLSECSTASCVQGLCFYAGDDALCEPGAYCRAESGCAPGCPEAQILCEGACIDPETDRTHCGARGSCLGEDVGTTCAWDSDCAEGACTSPRLSFFSPGGAIDGAARARATTYTLGAPVPATIHYTLDGSEPLPGGPTTLSEPAPVRVALMDTGELRFRAEIEGALEPGAHRYTHTTDAVNRQINDGFLVEALDINGQGPFATVAPGAALTVRFGIQHWNSGPEGWCPGCILQAVTGLEGVGRLDCRNYSGVVYPGTTAPIEVMTNAPATPGRYALRTYSIALFRCEDTSPDAVGGEVVGFVDVVE